MLDPLLGQKGPFVRAGRAKDRGPGSLHQLHRGLANPTRRGVDQHPFPGLHTCALIQGLIGGQKGHRNRRGRFKTQPRRQLAHLCGGDRDKAGKGPVGQCHHAIADAQSGHRGSNGAYHTSAFKTKGQFSRCMNAQFGGVMALQQPQNVQHIAEIQPRGFHFNFHFMRRRGAPALRLKLKVIGAAIGRQARLERRVRCGTRRGQVIAKLTGHEARHSADPLLVGNFGIDCGRRAFAL